MPVDERGAAAAVGIGQPVARREDFALLTGAGCFVADRAPPGLAHAVVLRSPHAHARVTRLDAAAARAAPGVLAVYTAADLAADNLGAIPSLFSPPDDAGFVGHPQPVLAADTVRFVGDCVAFVAAATAHQARDAAELVAVDFEPLPAVTDADAALAAGAPRLWDDAPGNRAFRRSVGDRAATDAAFAAADHVVTLRVVNNRIGSNHIETRGALGEWHDGRLTLTTGSQMPNVKKEQLAGPVLGVDPDSLRVVVGDVGGGFGVKNSLYPEQVLVLHAARKLGRPVSWIGDRGEAFAADYAGRDLTTRAEMALDGDGGILGVRFVSLVNLGAYTSDRAALSPLNSVTMVPNVYRVPALHAEVCGVYTNVAPTTVFRGAGRPEAINLIERLIDAAAHDLGIDRVALRRRNLVPADDYPHRTVTGLTYDRTNIAALIDEALARADWEGCAARKAAARQCGRLRGIGLASYIEKTGGGPGFAETARLRIAADGGVEVLVGAMANGQGHATAFSQIVAERLGLGFDRIEVVEGDTDRVRTGRGTGGSWSTVLAGGAIWLAADRVIDKGRVIAAHLLEAAADDVEFVDGGFRVAGTDRTASLAAVAAAAHDPAALPPGIEPGLDEAARFEPDAGTFPHGCHVCEVEIDGETGAVEIIAYTAVHDFGRALNPLLLAGQLHGGVAQGLGQALHDDAVYDGDGQLLTGSFMDYRLARADDLPAIDFIPRGTPAGQNAMGIKGAGECGVTGAPPAATGAVADALGVRHVDMPATAEKLWRLIREQAREDKR